MPDSRTLFMTGYPGFIGRKLIEKALEAEPGLSVICLVEPRFEFRAREEARLLGAGGDACVQRVEIVTGDITVPDLGLDAGRLEDLAGRVTDVFHLAAIYDLAVPEPAARRVNVWGTRHVIDLCRRLKKLRRFVYYSTCYVCGLWTGVFHEDDLDLGQGFKNHYESTKHDAEFLVRRASRDLPTVIIRPPIVVGHSITGETQKFDGPYFGMVLIDKLKTLGLPLPYLGGSMAEVNFVPVDYVVDGTIALWRKEPAATGCYALADPHPLLARELYAEIVRGLGARGPMGRIPPWLLEMPLRLRQVRSILEVPEEILTYFNHQVHFDCTRALQALEGTNVSCPEPRSYLPNLFRFYQGNRDRRELRWTPV